MYGVSRDPAVLMTLRRSSFDISDCRFAPSVPAFRLDLLVGGSLLRLWPAASFILRLMDGVYNLPNVSSYHVQDHPHQFRRMCNSLEMQLSVMKQESADSDDCHVIV